MRIALPGTAFFLPFFPHIFYRQKGKEKYYEKTLDKKDHGRGNASGHISAVQRRRCSGREDPGPAPGSDRYRQRPRRDKKGINLKIAGYLGEYLEEEGFQVVFTREDDRGLYEEDSPNKKNQDLKKRCEIIEETDPLLTVSIHQNSYQDQSVCGPQVFYYTGSEKGQELAACIQETLNEELEIQKPRKAKANDSYYLLKKSKGTINIVETGFLTNPREAELLQTEEYQKKCARAISSGILKFLKIVEKEGADVV